MMGLQLNKSASTLTQKRTSLSSRAPAEHVTVGSMIQKRRNFEEENYCRTQRTKSGKTIALKKIPKKGEEGRSEGESQKGIKEAGQGARHK